MIRSMLALTAAAATALTTGVALTGSAGAATATPGVAFTSNRDGDHEIYYRTPDGTVTQLTNNRVSDYGPVWSPDGRQLAFVSNRDGDEEVFVMNADGRNVRQLTRNSRTPDGAPAFDQAPAWSPDGRRIAFASNRAGGESEIYVVNTDGTGTRRLTRTAAYVSDHTPAWSPNGLFLVFGSNRVSYENFEIYRLRVDNGQLVRLTRTANGIDDNSPEYSPDGRTIVFSSNRRAQQDIWLMNGDGSGVRGLTGDSRIDEVFPRWTSDGTQVVFSSFAGGAATSEDVWVIDADRTDRRQLIGGRTFDSHADPRP